MAKIMKTEHNGAKNGGGYWGTRVEAKQRSKKVRRRLNKIYRRTAKILPRPRLPKG